MGLDRPFVVRLQLALTIAAFALAALTFDPSDWHPAWLIAALTGLAVFADRFSLKVDASVSWTGSWSIVVLAILVLGPGPAVAVGVVATLIDGVWRGRDDPGGGPRRRAPRAEMVTEVALAAWIGAGFGALVEPVAQSARTSDVAFFLIGFMACLVGSGLTFVWIGLAKQCPLQCVYFTFVPLELLAAVVTAGAAELYLDGDDAAMIVLAASVVVSRYLALELATSRERAAELAEVAETRRRLLARVADAEASVRSRLAKALHEGPVQSLLAARQDIAEHGEDPVALARADAILRATVSELRTVAFELDPIVLQALGFRGGLERLAAVISERHRIVVGIEVEPGGVDGQGEVLYSVARELLTNAAKHSLGETVTCRVSADARGLRMEVIDDGCGFDDGLRLRAAAAGHLGLATIVERVRERGGEIRFEQANPQGSRVIVRLPVTPADDYAALR